MRPGLALTALIVALSAPLPAKAGLEFCNQTGQEQSIAIGHRVDGVWTSQGWWNIADGACAEPLTGPLQNRYYYYRAEVPNGTFEDDGHLFCVASAAFLISGQDGCTARGYERAGFALIDTGASATHFTLTLVPPSAEDTPPD